MHNTYACQQQFEQAAIAFDLSALKSLKQLPRCQQQASVATWIILTTDNSSFTLQQIMKFIQAHPGWPFKKIIKNAELLFKHASSAEILAWTQHYAPQTGAGVMGYLQAIAENQPEYLENHAKKLWLHTPLSSEQERNFIELYGHYLHEEHYHHRVLNFINNKDKTAIKRLLPHLSLNHREIIIARIALMENDADAESLFGQLSPQHQADSALCLNYIQWLVKQKDSRAYDIIQRPKIIQTVDAHALWKEMHILIRRSLENNDWAMAVQLVKKHPLKDGADYFDAEWLRGWLLLHVEHQHQHSREIFKKLYHAMKTPICRAKSAFWHARTFDKHHNIEAQLWYKKAAHYPTTFYGQQAATLLHLPILLPRTVPIAITTQTRFDNRPLVKAIKLLKQPQLQPYVRKFMAHLLITVPKDEQILVAKLAVKLDPEFSVAAAKEVARYTAEFVPEAYKILPSTLVGDIQGVDLALIHAVIRKESAFNSQIVSSAGALGIMQVMPETARKLAEKLKLPFYPDDLKQASYNIKLGSEYIRQQLDKFKGSMVLMLAAYNAGPRPVQRWIATFGDPRSAEIDVLEWIEKIPYGETRNYVQRVMENYGVYKALLKKSTAQPIIAVKLKPKPKKKPKRYLK